MEQSKHVTHGHVHRQKSSREKKSGSKDRLTDSDQVYIQACALVLTNGQKLNDSNIKRKIEEAKKSFGGAGGGGRDEKNSRKRKRDSAQEDGDDVSYCPREEICPMVNCTVVQTDPRDMLHM